MQSAVAPSPIEATATTGRLPMPAPVMFSLVFATGVTAALAGRSELRVTPRPALLTRSFGAFAIYAAMLLLPVSVYFYIFHGDWFLLYLIDARAIPSAVALVGFLVEMLVGAAGFAVGATLVRGQREALAGTLAGAVLLAGAISVVVVVDRLSLVGSFAQYQGRFGLVPYSSSPVMHGTIVMSVWILIGLAYLLLRLLLGGKRRR